MRQEAEQFSQTLRMQMEQEEEERKRREFEETAASLSHLRSTSAIPGVFGSKTGITTAEAFGAPVEELLTQTAKKVGDSFFGSSFPLTNDSDCVLMVMGFGV